jgi:hypothetical protein
MKETISDVILAAESACARVDFLAEKLGEAEFILEGGYAELASALLVVQQNHYWDTTHESWGDYFKCVAEKFNLGRSQLYHKVAVVKELDGVLLPEELTQMGISKASVLADAHRANPCVINDTVVENAKNKSVTVKQLKKAIAEATHAPEATTDDWFDMNFAFYVTPEEKAELMEAMDAARGVDPPISTTLKDFMQRKEIALRFAREFLATYSTKEEEVPF